jgi:hypothetical protein
MTSNPPSGGGTAGSIGARLAAVVEQDQRLDGVVAAFADPAQRLTATPRRRALLLGRQLGHALHPVLTDLPIGCWTSSWLLDVLPVGGSPRASQRLIALGLLSAVPTAVTGWAEWSRTDQPEIRRVGVVHAAANTGALALYTGSWLARRSGRHRAGVALGQLGALTVSAGGFLGAHMAIGRKVGSSAVE